VAKENRAGPVYLVGAGPGDPGLLTRKAAHLLKKASVIIHDGLVPSAVLGLASPGAEFVYAGKKLSASGAAHSQEAISALMIQKWGEGGVVVRLKGGDPFVFGRGAEECEALAAAGVPFEIVPGISSLAAVPAYAGIPLTARGTSATVAFATGHEAAGKPSSDVDWTALARAQTVVLFMAVKTLADCAMRLIAGGKAADTPCAVIRWGTTASQECVVGTLSTIATEAKHVLPPALVVVGDVVHLRETLRWANGLPMFGLRCLISRGGEGAEAYVDALSAQGAEPLPVPLTRFEEPNRRDSEALSREILGLSTNAWILFASGTAVHRFAAQVAASGRDARALAGIQLGCVGPATARALATHGLTADLVAPRASAAGLAEALLKRGAKGRVLIPRAEGGRVEIIDRLTAAGTEVVPLTVYRTVCQDPTHTHVVRLRHVVEAGGLSAAAFLAPSQVNAFFDLIGANAAAVLNRCRVVGAIGETTRAALLGHGVTRSVVPSSPGPTALAEAMSAAVSSVAQEES